MFITEPEYLKQIT